MATEIRFPVVLDDSQAAKDLDKLVNRMDKLKESIAKNESARAPIVEQLKEAQDAAVEAYNRVEQLKAALATSESRAQMAPFVENVFKVEKALTPLISRVERLKKEIEATDDTAKKADLAKQLENEEAGIKAAVGVIKNLRAELKQKEIAAGLTPESDIGTYLLEEQKQARIKAELAEQEKIMQAKEQDAQKLEAADTAILEKLAEQTAELEKAQTHAGELTKQIADATKGKDIKAAFAAASASLQSGTKNILKWGAGITSVVILARRLRTYIIEAVKSFAENDPDTKASIDALSNSLNTLKASWGAAFAPVLNAVIPVLQTLISWLAAAASAIAQFFAILSGKGTFKKAVANTDKIASGMGGAADAAKEARKQLMGIDELNIMNDNNTGGGGGGGGAGNAFEWVEEAIDTDSFIGRLALSFKDVFIDWDNLTGEQIVEKIIAGLGGLAGAVIGFSIGGVPGALVGTLAGLTLGLVADAVLFDHDGQLSTQELMQSLLVVLGYAAGGVIGFSFGGVKGAAIGATIGAALMLSLRNVTVEADAAWNAMGLLEKISLVLAAIVGGVIGFSVGGVAGAALGMAIGAELVIAIKNIQIQNDASAGGKDWVYWFLHDICHLPSDQEIVQWLWDDGLVPAFGEVKTLFTETLNAFEPFADWFNYNVKPWFDPVMWGALAAQSISELGTSIAEIFNIDSIAQWFNYNVKPWFDPEIWYMFGKNSIDKLFEGLRQTWENVKAWWAKITLPEFHIKKPTFRWLGEFSLHPLSVPYLDISWAAKGGIVDGATLVGAGEAGKEAIVPLERNTQWIRNLALELSGMLFDEDAFTQIADKIALVPTALDRMTAQLATMTMPALPAVATGSVVPPNAAVTYTGITPELAEKLSNFLDKFGKDGSSSPIEVYPVVELDGVRVSKQLHSYTKRETRMHGNALIEVN